MVMQAKSVLRIKEQVHSSHKSLKLADSWAWSATAEIKDFSTSTAQRRWIKRKKCLQFTIV